MRLKRYYLYLTFICMFILFTNIIEVNAMNTEFSTEELTKEDEKVFLSNVGLSLLVGEPAKKGVLCFDVNEKGMVAIGQKCSDSKEVCVYSSDGTFLYGYTFKCSQNFAVEWDGECTNIYFIRSDVIISLDPDGNILDIKKVQNTINNNTHRNDLLYSTSRVVGNTTYLIRNNMGIFNWIATKYSQVIAIDANGAESIIYDVSSTQLLNTLPIVVVLLMVISVAIAIVILLFIRRGTIKEANQGTNQGTVL